MVASLGHWPTGSFSLNHREFQTVKKRPLADITLSVGPTINPSVAAVICRHDLSGRAYLKIVSSVSYKSGDISEHDAPTFSNHSAI